MALDGASLGADDLVRGDFTWGVVLGRFAEGFCVEVLMFHGQD